MDKPTIAKISTFDGFHYELKIGNPKGGSFPCLVSVTADSAGEPATTASEKLAREQKFSARTFLVPSQNIELLLQPRTAFLAVPPAPASGTTAPSTAAPSSATP
jgi:hypothetical protein